MKKIKGLVLVLIMLTLTLVPSFSDGENETTLEIVAYKVGEPYLAITSWRR